VQNWFSGGIRIPAEFKVLKVYNYPSEVEDGGYVYCWFDVQNIGDETSNPWMFLTEIDEYGIPIEGKEIDRSYGSALAPGQTGTYSLGGYLYFQNSEEELWVLVGVSSDPSEYQDAKSFRVRRKEVAPPPPDIRVVEVKVEPETVEVGEAFSVKATLENRGGTGGTATVQFTLDGKTLAEKSVYVGPSERKTVTVNYSAPSEPGSYQVCAGLV